MTSVASTTTPPRSPRPRPRDSAGRRASSTSTGRRTRTTFTGRARPCPSTGRACASRAAGTTGRCRSRSPTASSGASTALGSGRRRWLKLASWRLSSKRRGTWRSSGICGRSRPVCWSPGARSLRRSTLLPTLEETGGGRGEPLLRAVCLVSAGRHPAVDGRAGCRPATARSLRRAPRSRAGVHVRLACPRRSAACRGAARHRSGRAACRHRGTGTAASPLRRADGSGVAPRVGRRS